MRTTSHTSPVNRSGQLVGRERDLGVLRAFVHDVKAQGGGLIVRGDPGIGKTAIVGVVVIEAVASGVRIVRASGSQFEAAVSFAGLSQVLSTLHDDVATLAEPHRSALSAAVGLGIAPTTAVSAGSVTDATVELLRRLALTTPVLVVIDDLPWLDRASAVVLSAALRALPHAPVGLLGTARTGEESFLDTRGLAHHHLQPLYPTAAAELIDGAFPQLATVVRTRLLDAAAGNPLALRELGTALTDEQRVGVDPLPGQIPLTRRLHRLYELRVRDLDPGLRRLLLLAALHDAADVAGVFAAATGDANLAVLAPAVDAQLLDIDAASRAVLFRHPLVPATVVEMSTAPERRRAHEELAVLVADDEHRATRHLAEAALQPDESLAARLERLARDVVLRGDPLGGIAALLRAADLSPQSSERTRRMALAAYLGADVSGDLGRATDLLEAARESDPGVGTSLEAAMAACYLLLNGSGDVDTAHRLLVGAVDAHAGSLGCRSPMLAEALHNLLEICLYGAREELWASYEARLPLVDLAAFPVLALWAATMADPARTAAAALPDMDAAIAGLTGETDITAIERIATAAIYVDRVDDARPALWRAVDAARTGDAITAGINAQMLLTVDDFKRGLWDEGIAGVAEGLGWCDAHGYRLLQWPLRLAEGLIAGARGHREEAETIADEMERWSVPRGALGPRNFARHIRAVTALTSGDYEQAYEVVATISPPGTLAPHQGHALWVAMDLVEAAVRLRRSSEASAHVTALHAAGVAALSTRLSLQVAGATAMAGDDLNLFERAVNAVDAARWPFDLARIQLAYGERLRRARRAVAARHQLTDAHEIFIRLGARPWADHAERELRATTPHRAPGDSKAAAGLTPQERSVASLAATGWTNKQIADRLMLSPRTVAAHLSRVFAKLDVQTRAGLRDAIGDLDDPLDA